ncbi:MAG: glycosyltransferase family 4 protein [Actinomycetota bacterium]|nr:glycosyltransferase family 4 protein [Actinomycetota bacterium]
MGKLTRRLVATRRVWRKGGAHIAVLERPVPDLIPLPSGYIDRPLQGGVLPRELVTIQGWALFPDGPPTRVEVWLGEVALGPARLGGPRPDVQGEYGLDGLVAGWELMVDLGLVPHLTGEVSIRAVATGPGRELHALPPVVAFVAPVMERHATGREQPRRPAPAPLATATEADLRLLAFTHRLDLGGAQLILNDLLLAMRRASSVDCVVVSPFDGELRAPLEEAGIRVHVDGPIPHDDPTLYAGRVEELAAWTASGAFDVVLINNAAAFAGADAALRVGIPALWAIHESYPPATLWRLAWPGLHPEVRRRAGVVLEAADAAIFEAEATRRQYVAHVGGPCLTRPYGLDLAALEAARAEFDNVRARQERGIPVEAEVVLAVGTTEPRKAQIPLSQAFGRVASRHPNALLVVIGAGEDPYSHALCEYARGCAWADQVRVLPLLSDTWPWYGLADLMACASDLESLPRSVLEAMWWETPVVATSIFGVPDVIEHGRTGWLCDPRDVSALADALDVALSSSRHERQAKARASRAVVQERHDLERYAEECEQMLRRLVVARTVMDEPGTERPQAPARPRTLRKQGRA